MWWEGERARAGWLALLAGWAGWRARARTKCVSAGTRTSSSTSSVVLLARMPHLSLMICPSEKPGMPRSTRKSEWLRALPATGAASRAYTRKASPSSPGALAPLVIHSLRPLST